MFKFDKHFFATHQERLLKIANSRWWRWLLGINRLPKHLKDKKWRAITPNALLDTEFKGYHFIGRPRFAEALAYNLSPISYLQIPQKPIWRLSPVGVLGMLACILFPKLIGGFAFIGATSSYYSSTGNGACHDWVQASWDAAHDHGGVSVFTDEWDAFSLKADQGYYFYRAFFPTDCSAFAYTVSSAKLYAYVLGAPGYWKDDDNDGDDWINVVGATDQASFTALAASDFNNCGAVDNPTEWATRIDIGNISQNAWCNWSLNATGITALETSISGDTYFAAGLREGHDCIDSPITGSGEYGNGVGGRSSAYTGTTYDPYLEITYTPPSNIKTYNTNTLANIKTINTNAIANVKTLDTNA